jgi:glucose/arabinose dehydrogenase
LIDFIGKEIKMKTKMENPLRNLTPKERRVVIKAIKQGLAEMEVEEREEGNIHYFSSQELLEKFIQTVKVLLKTDKLSLDQKVNGIITESEQLKENLRSKRSMSVVAKALFPNTKYKS